jgi:prepilin peptidase CpaA
MMDLMNATNGSSSLILMSFLAAAAASDIHSRRIPNVLVLIMLVCGSLLHMAYLGGTGILTSLAGILLGFVILIPFYAFGALGAGDVKLLSGAGAFLGGWGVAVAACATLIVGGLLGLVVIFWQRVGAVLTARFFSVPSTLAATTDAVTIPYSTALAAGSLLAIYQFEAITSLLFS